MSNVSTEKRDLHIERLFDELCSLEDGWFDGQGYAPDATKLAIIRANVVGHYPENLPLPAIVPTPEGDILLEWDVPGCPSVDIALSNMKAHFHAFNPGQNDLELDFDLSAGDEWTHFFGFLGHSIGQTEA